MFYALDEHGVVTDACEAAEGEKYTCPICNNPVVLKRGAVNADHFAHKSNECEDNWNYDMSVWHRRMQKHFPKEAQEVVVNHHGEKHRADVLIDDIVLEFQYSPISAAEFDDRNEFFKKAGYRLAWVFNLSRISDDNLYISDTDDHMMIWKHPMRIFSNIDYLGENNKRFALWFSFQGDDEFENSGEESLDRVIWAIRDDDGYYSLRRFYISDFFISMSNEVEVNPEWFFNSRQDFLEENKLCLKKIISELKSKNKSEHSYVVKYKGEKGKSMDSYVCPRNNKKFGIDLWGKRGCCYCRFCYMVVKTQDENGMKYASYCFYPEQVRELKELHPGFECPGLEPIEI